MVTAAQRQRDVVYEAFCREASSSLDAFLDRVVIDCLPEPQPFKAVKEWWQVERNERLVPAFEFVAGLKAKYDGPMSFWEGATKGADKTSFLGRVVSWLLGFAPRQSLRVYVGAKDGEQAGIIRDAMTKEARLNGWFKDRLDFTKKVVRGVKNGSELHILTADAGGSQGKVPDVLICDELTVWDDEPFFNSLYSGVAKRGDKTGRQRCLVAILTNAGILGSWQDRLRGIARDGHGKTWSFNEQRPGPPLASWISPQVVAENCRFLTPSEGNRLWRNIWIDANEDRGVFRPESVDECVGPPATPPPGATVFLAVDYGEITDPTALTVVWYDGDVLHVVELATWQGSRQMPIQISDVDGWLDRKLDTYPNAVVVLDAHQLVGTEQRLQARGVTLKRFAYRGGVNNFRLAENLRTLLTNKKIRFAATAGLHPDGSTLADELKRVVSKKMTYGYKIDHDSGFHDDRVVVVGMAALHAVAETPPPPQKQLATRPPSPAATGRSFVANQHFVRRGLYGLS